MSEGVLRPVLLVSRRFVVVVMFTVAMTAGTTSACAPALRATAVGVLTPEQQAELWIPPADLERRDLFFGPGGADLAPSEGSTFEFREEDRQGYSRGYDVVDASEREWSVKLGPEAQSEIAASRLLWAAGYHQPPMYLVRSWHLAGGPRPGHQPPGRFRPDLPHARRVSDWSWQQNQFVGTQAFRGLIVINLLINNWDLKSTNNKVYRIKDHGEGPSHWYIVRDLGAAFGKTRAFPYGTRNDIDDFESQQFVLGVRHGRVEFDYHGRHRELLADLTPSDVVWACSLMAQISDRQLDAAFRAGGYEPAVRARFVTKLKEKIAQGLALAPGAANGDRGAASRETLQDGRRS